MKWVTGVVVHLDPAACAWVIRRVIDPDAEFVFLPADTEPSADAIPFDLPGAELSRREGPEGPVECCVETILRHYEVMDPTLWRIAEIVHVAQLCDDRYFAPEARGIRVLVDSLAMVGNDAHTLAITKPIFDGLYRHFYYSEMLGQVRGPL